MRRNGLGLLIAGLAAYGYYRFSKMSPAEKTAMKQKAKKMVNDNLGSFGNLFGKKNNPGTATNNFGQP